jgi:hypothetical protein
MLGCPSFFQWQSWMKPPPLDSQIDFLGERFSDQEQGLITV